MKSWVVVALVGCGAAVPAAPIASPPPVAPHEPRPVETDVGDPQPPVVTAPPPARVPSPLSWPLPPALDLAQPSVEEYGRWPLTIAEHPVLEPHFDIAAALADSGVTWTDLCARGAQSRHMSGSQELVDYLGAWCDVARRDYEAAVEKLGTVRRSTTRGLARAVTFDVAAITAAHGDAHDLEGLLRRGAFLTLEEVDLVAASYFEIGRLADAAEANRLATQMDYAPTETARCKRLLRAIDDAQGGDRDDRVEMFKQIAHPTSDTVGRCVIEEATFRCANKRDCVDYWVGDGTTTNRPLVGALESVRVRWPRSTIGGPLWSYFVGELIHSGPPRDKYAMLIPAAGLAVRASDCDTEVLSKLESHLRLAAAILEPTPAKDGWNRFDTEVHDFEAIALSKAERAALRTRIGAIAKQAHAINMVVGSRMVCLDELARLPPMVP